MAETVVVVVLDSMRYDFFQAFIETHPDSFLAGFTDRSTSFRGATAPAPWSLPSHASMFTGLDPVEHGALRAEDRIAPAVETLLDHLPDTVSTGCFTSNAFISPEYGFDGWGTLQSFPRGEPFPVSPGEYDRANLSVGESLLAMARSETPLRQFINSAYRLSLHTRLENLFDDGGHRMTANATAWLRSLDTDDPAFLFLNYFETHDRHSYLTSWPRRLHSLRTHRSQRALNDAVGPEFYFTDTPIGDDQRRAVRRLVLDELAYVDRQLERLWETLADQGRLTETTFVLCADHGDGLGEHGMAYHLVGVTEPILRVPLEIYTPASEAAPDEITDRVSLSWLHDTLLGRFGGSGEVDLLDPASYPRYVSAVNTRRIEDLARGRPVPEEYLRTRRAVYESADPRQKYRRVDEDDTVWEVDAPGLDERQVAAGGTEHIEAYLAGIEPRAERSAAALASGTRSALEDLGYL